MHGPIAGESGTWLSNIKSSVAEVAVIRSGPDGGLRGRNGERHRETAALASVASTSHAKAVL
jgi:hypothetical protein